ncbi:hypothetical protein GCM10029964_098990 [Kibdelosporangium lantanae]
MPDHEVAGARVSPREVEVLTALGEYLTNPEIAARLYISIRTVESHVSSLLRKLGVRDRRALAALAREVAGTSVPRVPHALTPLVGRSAERRALARVLGENRLVTAVGPGGVGKTRLALAVAEDVVSRDGVRYVDLVPVAGDATVSQAVAAGLGVTEENLATWAENRQLLLVLDNCEHVVDGVVVLVERLLRHSAGVTVLATSRVRLSVPFERVFPVAGLAQAEAERLFVARAEAAGATEVVGDRIGRICAALDGVPLAIELAAARVAAVGLDGVEDGLVDQLTLLSGARRVDDRHRSLRSALDWSYQLLDEHPGPCCGGSRSSRPGSGSPPRRPSPASPPWTCSPAWRRWSTTASSRRFRQGTGRATRRWSRSASTASSCSRARRPRSATATCAGSWPMAPRCWRRTTRTPGGGRVSTGSRTSCAGR